MNFELFIQSSLISSARAYANEKYGVTSDEEIIKNFSSYKSCIEGIKERIYIAFTQIIKDESLEEIAKKEQKILENLYNTIAKEKKEEEQKKLEEEQQLSNEELEEKQQQQKLQEKQQERFTYINSQLAKISMEIVKDPNYPTNKQIFKLELLRELNKKLEEKGYNKYDENNTFKGSIGKGLTSTEKELLDNTMTGLSYLFEEEETLNDSNQLQQEEIKASDDNNTQKQQQQQNQLSEEEYEIVYNLALEAEKKAITKDRMEELEHLIREYDQKHGTKLILNGAYTFARNDLEMRRTISEQMKMFKIKVRKYN
jgi:hypothetical protein